MKPTATKDLRAEAEAWIDANPQAYAIFVRFAKRAATMGRPFGIGLLTERVRWEAFFDRSDTDGYKINNNHRAYIARRLVEDVPEAASLLRFRGTGY